PTDTSARLARAQEAIKALCSQLSCAPAAPVFDKPRRCRLPRSADGAAGDRAQGGGAAMPGSGAAPWGSAPGGPGGGMGIEVGPPGAGGRLAPLGIGASEAYVGGAVPFGVAIGE